ICTGRSTSSTLPPATCAASCASRRATFAAARSPTTSCARKTSSAPRRSASNTARQEDLGEGATLDERAMQYMYSDGSDYYFMDTDTFEQIHISSEALGDSVNYLIAEMVIQVELYGSEPVGIELPQTVDLLVQDPPPAIKGATASAQLKPATLETGP